MQVDTGACKSVIHKKDYKKYFSRYELKKYDYKLKSVSGEVLKVLGSIKIVVEGVNKYYHASSLRLCNHIIDQSDIYVPIERTQVSGYWEPLFQPENNNTEFENIEEKGQIDDLVLNRDLNYKENIDTHNENEIHRESDISNGSRPELRRSTRIRKSPDRLDL
ncbi:hypothetical protein ACJJTC_001590 [Scirpophaga incertulas]